MNKQKLINTVNKLLANNKGLIAMDESNITCNKRFAALNIPQTAAYRCAYRELIISTPNLNKYISGAILYEETIHQHTAEGIPFINAAIDAGLTPGIKVDKGTVDFANHPNEKITEGIDGLRERLNEYDLLGLHFAKWRGVIKIDNGIQIPSTNCIIASAHLLARYAAICQEVGLVPIIEPEVLMEGNHTIEQCFNITRKVLQIVFDQLYKQKVWLEGLILKPNMIVPGMSCFNQSSINEVADATITCLLQSVPSAVPGIAFLSGGQLPHLATAHLNAMHVQYKNKLPWHLTFSFSRAIQQPALEIWLGKDVNVIAAQNELLYRAASNKAACSGTFNNI